MLLGHSPCGSDPGGQDPRPDSAPGAVLIVSVQFSRGGRGGAVAVWSEQAQRFDGGAVGRAINADEWTTDIVVRQRDGWRCLLTQLTSRTPS